jgi:hypothetical protein
MDSGWTGVQVEGITFSNNLQSITIRIREGSQTLSAVVPRSDRSRLQFIGQEGQAHLIRIRGSRADFNFQPVAS